MIPNNEIETSLELLNEFVKTQNVLNERVGLCANCELPTILKQCFKEWEHFSGEEGFPIPSTIENVTPVNFYYQHKKSIYTGEQLKFRLNLAEFLMQKLNEIKIEQDRIRNLP